MSFFGIECAVALAYFASDWHNLLSAHLGPCHYMNNGNVARLNTVYWLNRIIFEGYEFSSHKKNTFVTGQRQNMISMECFLTSQKSSITTCPQRSFLFVRANGAWYMILKHLMMAAMPLLCFSLIATFLLNIVSRSS